MADEDAIKKLEARLTRLETILAQQPGTAAAAMPTFRPIADQAWWTARPHPIVDPAVHWGTVVDPLPWPWGPSVDPATFAGAVQARAGAAAMAGGIRTIADPPPPDVSRYSIAQLEAVLHSINAEKARLASIETMVTQQLIKLKEQ